MTYRGTLIVPFAALPIIKLLGVAVFEELHDLADHERLQIARGELGAAEIWDTRNGLQVSIQSNCWQVPYTSNGIEMTHFVGTGLLTEKQLVMASDQIVQIEGAVWVIQDAATDGVLDAHPIPVRDRLKGRQLSPTEIFAELGLEPWREVEL